MGISYTNGRTRTAFENVVPALAAGVLLKITGARLGTGFRYKTVVAITAACLVAVYANAEVSGRQKADKAGGHASVVVTTTMLETAVRDAFPADKGEGLETRLLIPPGGCPGHFDLSPGFLPLLRRADLILIHEYQDDLRGKISSLTGSDSKIISVSDNGSPLIPDNYRTLLEEVQKKAAAAGADMAGSHDSPGSGEAGIYHTLGTLKEEAGGLRSEFKDVRVIASGHQSAFCRWLGFDVRGTMKRSENMTPGDLRRLLQEEADLVVANLQSGTQAARTLAERKGIPLVILSNFPKAGGFGDDFPSLFRTNLKKLEQACQKKIR